MILEIWGAIKSWSMVLHLLQWRILYFLTLSGGKHLIIRQCTLQWVISIVECSSLHSATAHRHYIRFHFNVFKWILSCFNVLSDSQLLQWKARWIAKIGDGTLRYIFLSELETWNLNAKGFEHPANGFRKSWFPWGKVNQLAQMLLLLSFIFQTYHCHWYAIRPGYLNNEIYFIWLNW